MVCLVGMAGVGTTGFQIELLGGISIRELSGEPCVLPTKKARALLAYLSLPAGRFHSRDKLTALLWGDTAEAQAKHSFRQALSTLRRSLANSEPPALLTQDDTFALRPAAVMVDVAAFESALAEGSREALERAAALYKGDLLDGFSVDEAPFEEWRVVERERLHELALEAMVKLMREHMRADDLDAAVRTAQRILALDPLQEPVHRALMRLLLRQGRRAAALQQYQTCVGALQRELGAEPDEETRTLYREIVRGEGAAGTRPTRAMDPALAIQDARRHRVESVLVGRRPDLAALHRALEQALEAGVRIAVVNGEAGVGKTRLIQEFTAEVASRGLQIVGASCHETEQALPFRPWVDALRGNAPALAADTCARLSAGACGSLVRLFPELGRPDDRPHTTTADEHALLFEALNELVQHLSDNAPLVIILEDLQCADAMSARLLAFLGRRLGSMPVLIVGTVRTEEVDETSVLQRALSELRAAGKLDEIALGALNRDESLILAQALRGVRGDGTVIEKFADELWALSEGNPFVIVETVRALREEPLGPGFTPKKVRRAVSERVARLSELARRTVAAAAVIGRPCSFRLLAESVGLAETDAATAVEELVRRRVLETVGDQLELSHDRVRQVVYDDLVPARRLVIHRAVAEALESLHAGSLDEVADELGHHFSKAAKPERALVYLERFAEVATRRYALDAALEVLRQASVAAASLPAQMRDQRQLELALRQCFVLSLAGQHPEVLKIMQDHAACRERVGNSGLSSDCYFRLAIAYQSVGRYVDGRQAAEMAIREGQRAGDNGRIGKGLYALSLMSIALGALTDAIEQGTRALSFLEPPSTRHWLALCYWSLTWAYTVSGRLEAGLESANQCAAVAELAGDRRLRAFARYITALVYVAYGEAGEALRLAREAQEASADPIATSLALLALGYAHLEGGDTVGAIDAFRQVLESRPASVTRARALAELGDASARAGDLSTGMRLAQEGLERGQADGAPFLVGLAERALGRIARMSGDPTRSEAHFTRALATFLSGQAVFEAARTRLDLAQALATRGDWDAAQAHLTEAVTVFSNAGAAQRVAEARELAASLRQPAARMSR